MDWVKLSTSYYDDPAVMRAGEAAEVLFTRALAYAGAQETGGVIPREVLPRLAPVRGAARAKALVAQGVWEVVPEGWRFCSWDKHQTSRDKLEAQRESGRRRQATHRARRNPVSNAVTNAGVTPREVEGEVEHAAAAASERRAAAAELPPIIDVFRSKLQANTPLAGLRFDTVTEDQAERLEDLIELHGDDRLVSIAMSTLRTPPPVSVTAFLGTWEALPPPGARLHAIKADPCTQPGHQGTTRHCGQCLSEQKAAQ